MHEQPNSTPVQFLGDMNQKRIILLGIAFLVVLFLLVTIWISPVDPIYLGKPLTQLLNACGITGYGFGIATGSDGMLLEPIEPRINGVRIGSLATEALLAQGTNALSLFVRMLTAGDTRIDRLRQTLVQKYRFPQWITQTNWVVEWETQAKALVAFHVLGSNAAPASGHLVRLLDNPETVSAAIVALKLVQPQREEHILSLTNVARIRKPSRRVGDPDWFLTGALLALGSFERRASNATPFVISQLSSTNALVQGAAAVALARIGAPSKELVPLITATLPNSDASLAPGGPGLAAAQQTVATSMKLWALEQFGTNAVDAVATISRFNSPGNSGVRAAAQKALRKIQIGWDVPNHNVRLVPAQ